MKLLSDAEFHETFATPMRRVALEGASSPVAFWAYFDAIPAEHFAGHVCAGESVSHAWADASGHFQHVLIATDHPNVFMAIVLDLREREVFGHRLLDLNREYGLEHA